MAMNAVEIVQAATQAFNEGRIEDALAFYEDAIVQRSPATDGKPGFKIRQGKEALRQVLQADTGAQVRFDHHRYIADGDVVAVEGTNRGLLNGVYVEQPVAVFYEVTDGKIASVTVYYDRLALRQILGQT